MDVIGTQEITVEQRVGSNWYPYWIHSVEDYPEFYDYNNFNKSGTFYFNGVPGTTYHVVMTVYAEKNGGWDTGEAILTSKIFQ